MIALLKRYPVISALGIAAAVLIAVVALELASGSTVRSQLASGAPQPAGAVQAKVLPPIAALDPEVAYAETGARPLLTPTRRPAPEKAAVATSSMAKGQYTLTGVTIVGPLRIALLREKSSGRVVRVEKGKEISGVMVAEIEPERVTLALGGDSEVLNLQVQKGAAGAPAAAPSGPFAPPAAAAAPQPAPAAAPTPPPAAPRANPAARAEPPTATTFGPFNRSAAPGQPGAAPDAAPLSPEELLARRRARRTQQSQ
jgi:hypothetical protein